MIALVAVFGGPDDGGGGGAGGDDRQVEVAERGATVMPFDLETTTHVFEKTDEGGVQTVVADDDAADDQPALIREHLDEEATAFASGDYADPRKIHGDEMPGLAELQGNIDAIDVSYSEVPGGAQITYATDDPALVEAIHQWFDAQLADHGDHATGG